MVNLPNPSLPQAPVQMPWGRLGAVLAAFAFTAGAFAEFTVPGVNGRGLALGLGGAIAVLALAFVLGMRQLQSGRRFQDELARFCNSPPATQ